MVVKKLNQRLWTYCRWVNCSEKEDLKPAAAAKVEQITAQLQTPYDSKPFDSVERIKEGFIYFKREKYE